MEIGDAGDRWESGYSYVFEKGRRDEIWCTNRWIGLRWRTELREGKICGCKTLLDGGKSVEVFFHFSQ